jgi:ribokinase
MSKPIIVVGSINIDLVATANRVPAVGETLIGNDFHTFFGGKGANQAVAAARLGANVHMIGKVGDDAFGRQLRDALAEDGVNVEAVDVVEGSSGVALIVTGAKGENIIVVVPGANGKLLPSDLDRHRDKLASASVVLTQMEIPMRTLEHLGELCKQLDVPLILDPAPAAPLSGAFFKSIQWITPNESETRTLLGLPYGDEDENYRVAAARRLLSLGPNVILKLGSEGAYLATHEGVLEHIPSFQVSAVDSTAAGDAFNGAFAVALSEKLVLREGLQFAAAVAAISVTRRGAQPSMPRRSEVVDLLRKGQQRP